jgi:hypothetical protein
LTQITCSRCSGNVYEYGYYAHGLERAVTTMTGCTTYSCYQCGRRGWVRKGQNNLWIAILARTTKVLIPLAVAAVVALTFAVLLR